MAPGDRLLKPATQGNAPKILTRFTHSGDGGDDDDKMFLLNIIIVLLLYIMIYYISLLLILWCVLIVAIILYYIICIYIMLLSLLTGMMIQKFWRVVVINPQWPYHHIMLKTTIGTIIDILIESSNSYYNWPIKKKIGLEFNSDILTDHNISSSCLELYYRHYLDHDVRSRS